LGSRVSGIRSGKSISEDEERVSNERDAASGDGLEPVDPSAAADAAGSSPAAGAASESSAGDDKPRSAPAGDGPDQPDATDPDNGDGADSAEKAKIVATQPTAGPVAAGSARAAARRSAAQALSADGPDGSAAPRRKTESKGAPTPSRGSNVATRPNIFQRLGLFLREVVAELRKVIWPNRNQMVTYTIVVIVFVSFMVALVAVLDLLFARGVLAVFG
jgi:preprotein translocase subunit SecE